MPRQGGNGENERQRFSFPFHPSIPFRILMILGRNNRHHGSNEQMFGPE
jgi:hypothetical protein